MGNGTLTHQFQRAAIAIVWCFAIMLQAFALTFCFVFTAHAQTTDQSQPGVKPPTPVVTPAAPPAELVWTEKELVPHSTVIKADHINELRTAINAKRMACGLSAQVWTDDPIRVGITPIKKVHMDEIRNSANELVVKQAQINSVPAIPTSGGVANTQPNSIETKMPVYTDPVIEVRETLIKATHVSELRSLANTINCAAPVVTPPVVSTCTPPQVEVQEIACNRCVKTGIGCVVNSEADLSLTCATIDCFIKRDQAFASFCTGAFNGSNPTKFACSCIIAPAVTCGIPSN